MVVINFFHLSLIIFWEAVWCNLLFLNVPFNKLAWLGLFRWNHTWTLCSVFRCGFCAVCSGAVSLWCVYVLCLFSVFRWGLCAVGLGKVSVRCVKVWSLCGVFRYRACAAVRPVWCAAAVHKSGIPPSPGSSMPSSCCWGPLWPVWCCRPEWTNSSRGSVIKQILWPVQYSKVLFHRTGHEQIEVKRELTWLTYIWSQTWLSDSCWWYLIYIWQSGL